MDLKAHIREAHGVSALNSRLRQIVYGGNDGIVTTFAVVAGFAGAEAEGVGQIGTVAVILFGLANLLADATSMGLGEYLSSRAARDVYRKTYREEKERLRQEPDAEREEVLEILHQKGLSPESAVRFADELAQHPELMADFMMRYEFEFDLPEEGQEAAKGWTTFASFIAFGILPLLPFFLGIQDQPALLWSVAGSLFALLLLGLLRGHATGEARLRCVFETLLVGSVCGAVAYLVGVLVAGFA